MSPWRRSVRSRSTPAKHYYVSVLPNDAGTGTGHSIGGAQIPPGDHGGHRDREQPADPDRPDQRLRVRGHLLRPTASPTPPSRGLGGFQIILEDAGGRYGISGGTMSQDAFGNPLRNSLGDPPPAPPRHEPPVGVILTCPDGTALIKDLPPGKYGVIAVPPAGSGPGRRPRPSRARRCSDTWVKAGEPPFFVEFGAPGFHAFIGFVNPAHTTGAPRTRRATTRSPATSPCCTPARPPSAVAFDTGSYDALAHTRAWVGLNSSARRRAQHRDGSG